MSSAGVARQPREECWSSAKEGFGALISIVYDIPIIMPKSFDSVFEELEGLPSGSGPLECFGPRKSPERALEKLDKLLSVMANMSTFQGEALKNRVLAAHPPGRPSGERDDEYVASLPLAATALTELYTGIARNYPLFAPIVLGISLETTQEVIECFRGIRYVVEKDQHCSGLWHHSVFKGFVQLSKEPNEQAQRSVHEIISRREARVKLSQRIQTLLHEARLARNAGEQFCLRSVEDVWSVILAQHAREHDLPFDNVEEMDLLDATKLVEVFAAGQPGGCINAFDFAAADGAAVMSKIWIKAKYTREMNALCTFMINLTIDRRASDTGSAGSDESGIEDTLHKLLPCPRALPLLLRFLSEGEEFMSYSFPWTRFFRAALGHVLVESDDDDADAHMVPNMACEMPVREALSLCGAQFDDASISTLEQAVAENLQVSFDMEEIVPDGFMSPSWYSKVLPDIQTAIVATGLYARRGSNANEIKQRPTSQAEVAEAIERALVVLSRHSWFVHHTYNSRHPFSRVKGIAVHLLVLGFHLATAAQSAGEADFGGAADIASRFNKHWKSIFKTDGPPDDCPRGFLGSDYDGSCMMCGMPRELCPSLCRLRVEIREFMARSRNGGSVEEVAEVDLYSATAVVTTFQGGRQYPEAPPDVQEAANAMVAAGIVQKTGHYWNFTGPKRPVCFTCPDSGGVVAAMAPIT